jgi:hypothetical protein
MERRALWMALGAAGIFAGLSAWGLADMAKKTAQVMGIGCKPDCACQCQEQGCGCHEREKPFTPSRPVEKKYGWGWSHC